MVDCAVITLPAFLSLFYKTPSLLVLMGVMAQGHPRLPEVGGGVRDTSSLPSQALFYSYARGPIWGNTSTAPRAPHIH